MRPLNISGSQAEEYYYAKDAVFGTGSNSQWSGKLAQEFGLDGEVKEENFLNIIAGNNLSGHQIIQDGKNKNGENEHRAAVDIPFGAPKSVSIMALHVADENILSAHKEAVKDTIQYIEQNYVYARKTIDGNTRAYKTGSGMFATFDHSTSRANDPHLHTHTLCMNMTRTPDGYRAVFNDKIFKDQTLLNSVYQGFLSKRVREAGFGIEYNKNGLWEIAGVKDEWVKTFSKRQGEIDQAQAVLKDQGAFPNADDAKVRDLAQRSSRDKKDVSVSKDDLLDSWQEQVDRDEISKSVGKHMVSEKHHDFSESDYIKTAYEAINETESTFKSKDVLHVAMQLSRGHYTVYEIQTAFNQAVKDGQIVRLTSLTNSKGLVTDIYTSREMKRIEQNILDTFNRCHDDVHVKIDPMRLKRFMKSHYDFLTAGQGRAVDHILRSPNRFSVVQGDAGTGKTTAVEAVQNFLGQEKLDVDIIGLGYTGKAAKELEDKSGIKAKTIHGFLSETKKSNSNTKTQVWIVDESSMVGSKQMHHLMQKAVKQDAKLVFIGDGKQLQAIAAGKMFKDLQSHGRVKVVVLDEVLRQKTDDMKKLVGHISNYHSGHDPEGIDKAFKVLKDRQDIKFFGRASKRIDTAVQFYMDQDNPDDSLIVTPLNDDRIEINNRIRMAIKDDKSKKKEMEVTVKTPVSMVGTSSYFAKNYKVGHDVFVASSKIDDLHKGAEASVINVDEKRNAITLETGAGKQVRVDLKSNDAELSVYSREQRQFFEGDRIVFLKNDKAVRVQNSLTGKVEKIDNNGVFTVKVDDKQQRVTFHKDKFQYYDHGYAVTIHKSQGQTSRSVAFVTDCKSPMNNFESFYTAMTRAENQAMLICDNPNELKNQFKQMQGKSSVIDFSYRELQIHKDNEMSI